MALSKPEFSVERCSTEFWVEDISKKMKKIVSENVLTKYVEENCYLNEDYLVLRKEIS